MERCRVLPSASRKIVTCWRSQSNGPQRRAVSSISSINQDVLKETEKRQPSGSPTKCDLPPLSVMPTGILIRSLMMTYILSSPRLVALSIPIMDRISHSKSWYLNPDRNPVLHAVIRRLVYDHFCAGESEKYIAKTIDTTKNMGFEGVILGYAKEVIVDKSAGAAEAAGSGGHTETVEKMIREWKEGNLRTVGMLGKGDFLAVKFTGAGLAATEPLALCKPPSPQMAQAMAEICEKARRQGTRLWIDAEQQVFQKGIDSWAVDLMRKYNRDGEVLVYNTFQAYLKGTPNNITKHLELAQTEGWALGIKLVRGAYIAVEARHLIHDSIENTHAAYDTIVGNLLTKSFPGVREDLEFPKVQLMLASHNAESVTKGYETWKSRNVQGLPTIKMEIGQLQGMADEVSCGLVQTRQKMEEAGGPESLWYPRAFKCLCWGGIQECIQFLMRRVVENRGSLERTKLWMVGLKKELWRRLI